MGRFWDWGLRKIQDADMVGIGVNLVVALLLVGGLVGAFFAGSSQPPIDGPKVDAVVVQPLDEDNAALNETQPQDGGPTTMATESQATGNEQGKDDP